MPNELFNIICLYLDYNGSLELRYVTRNKIDYQYILSVRYPGFYQLFTDVKQFDVKYQNTSYEDAYNIIDQTERYRGFVASTDSLTANKKLSSEKLSEIYDIVYEEFLNVPEMMDLLSSYDVYRATTIPSYYLNKNKELYQYKHYFPKFPEADVFFAVTVDEYQHSNDTLEVINKLPEVLTDFEFLIYLFKLFLILLIESVYIPDIQEKLKKLNTERLLKNYRFIVIYQTIQNYLDKRTI